jgi:hypothetical protein
MLLAIHITAGGLAIILGAVALLVKKGGSIHRRVGLLFVYAMLVMGTAPRSWRCAKFPSTQMSSAALWWPTLSSRR